MSAPITLKIIVTAEDIAGNSHSSLICPDSMAVKRAIAAFSPFSRLDIGVVPSANGVTRACMWRVEVYSRDGARPPVSVVLPEEESGRLCRYDRHTDCVIDADGLMEPHTFDLEVPWAFLVDSHAVFEVLLAEANRLGFPERFESDLTHDHRIIERDQPSRFVWAIYDSGTHMVCQNWDRPDTTMRAIIRSWPHARYYTWSPQTGLQYVPDPETARAWLGLTTGRESIEILETAHA